MIIGQWGHPPVIDYATARQKVVEYQSRLLEHLFGTSAMVLDEKTVEFEWGWMLQCEPVHWDKVPQDHRMRRSCQLMVVDRETGYLRSVGSSGPNSAIIGLLQRRPPELRDHYMRWEPHGGLVKVTVNERAFIPRGRLEKDHKDQRNWLLWIIKSFWFSSKQA